MKRAFTLVELLLTLMLFSILLSTLFITYRHMKIGFKDNVEANRTMEKRYFVQRMQRILGTMDETLFFSTDDGFVFIFDHGKTMDPHLSGKVLAKFFYDTNSKSLAICYWPHPSKKVDDISGSMILLDEVKTAPIFEYYSPPIATPWIGQWVGKNRPQNGWNQEWREEYRARPAMLRIKIDGEVVFAFDLPPYTLKMLCTP